MKIFGREPAAVVGLIEGVLALLLTLNVTGLSQETIALIMAVVVAALGFYTAYVTHDTLLGVTIGLTKAVLALGIGYGLDLLTVDQTGALIAVITLAFGFFQRTQTTPSPAPSFTS